MIVVFLMAIFGSLLWISYMLVDIRRMIAEESIREDARTKREREERQGKEHLKSC